MQTGYVKDTDADDINYDDLLKDLKEGQKKANLERKKLGYGDMNIVGWASKPFYDKQNKVLHWAKELSSSRSNEDNTLNYDIRVLGTKWCVEPKCACGYGSTGGSKK